MSKYPAQYYRDYLQLDKILTAQDPVSARYGQGAHDEMLFIVVHQAYELWFKQILFELDSVITLFNAPKVAEHDVARALHRVQRVNAICGLLLQQIDVLETMTPLDFADFRDYLHPASGFQSLQFRILEIRLGLREAKRLNIGRDRFHSRLDDRDRAAVEEAAQQPKLLDLVEAWLQRTPFTSYGSFSFWKEYRSAVEAMYAREREWLIDYSGGEGSTIEDQLAQIENNKEQFLALFDAKKFAELQEAGAFTMSIEALQAALFISVYRDQPLLFTPFSLLQALVDMDEKLALWRYRHALMVSRMIGSKTGTGGSAGHSYLVQTSMKHKVFSDLLAINSFILPTSEHPPLPQEVLKDLTFSFGR